MRMPSGGIFSQQHCSVYSSNFSPRQQVKIGEGIQIGKQCQDWMRTIVWWKEKEIVFNRTVHRNDLQCPNCCELKTVVLSCTRVRSTLLHSPVFFFFFFFLEKKNLHSFVHDIRKATVSIRSRRAIAATQDSWSWCLIVMTKVWGIAIINVEKDVISTSQLL